MQNLKRMLVSDCEGPISKNDNAYELAEHFIPNGDKLFANISKYDDVLADILRKPGYSAGSTLKLILPFFKAYGVTDKQMQDFSAKNILLIPTTQVTLNKIKLDASVIIVSTSYEHYIKALCEAIEFPYENTYCTKVNLDEYEFSQQETRSLKKIAQEIAQMPPIDIPSTAKTVRDFSPNSQAVIGRLDQIFWSEIREMEAGKLFTDVVTVGGEQKAEAIRDATKRLGVELSNVMYVGDSITDVEAFKLVRDGGGLTISFNGNSYAVKNAEVAVLSESNLVVALVADLFFRLGKAQALKVVLSWCRQAVKESGVNPDFLRTLYTVYPKSLPTVQIVTARNMEPLIRESSDFRKKVRGIAIGRLG